LNNDEIARINRLVKEDPERFRAIINTLIDIVEKIEAYSPSG